MQILHRHPTNYKRQALRSCRKSIQERHRKSDATQDKKIIFFLFTIWKRRSIAFQPCITLGGVYWVEMGQNYDFLPKNGLKTAFLSITILDHPTSDWAGTQNFKGIANFNMCFEKFGTSASKWAMGKASSFDIVRLAATWIFLRGTPKNAKKRFFFGFRQITWDFDIETHIQGTTMWNPTSWRFRKCGSFWAYEFLNGSYCCSKLAHCQNFGSVTKNKRCHKKTTLKN